MQKLPIVTLVILLWIDACSSDRGCAFRRVPGAQSFVCVCNSTYCDDLPPLGTVTNKPVVFTTSLAGGPMRRVSLEEMLKPKDGQQFVNLTLDTTVTYQEIMGFGGCFTDTTIINMNQTSEATQNALIRSYFAENGLQLTLGRIPMASTDFANHIYSYDDTPGDLNLSHFSLSNEDLNYKIPMIKKANSLMPEPLKLFISPWSAPAWMKTSGKMQGYGFLKGLPGGEYHKTWANYFVKTIDAYKANNITLWGLTIENEPTAGYQALYTFQAMGFNATTERDFIKTDLGPALRSAGYGDLVMMICDDQRFLLPQFADVILNDPDAAQYVSGIAKHWYGDAYSPIQSLDYTHSRHPNHFILNTEATNGALPWEFPGVVLGSWYRAAKYAYHIINDLNHWVSGWMDWNFAVNPHGGPSWVGNRADSQIVVNATGDEFLKQPMYYAMAHFSKFVRPGSFRVHHELTTLPNQTVFTEMVASTFIHPKGNKVAILLNRDTNPRSVRITEASNEMELHMEPSSLITVVWK